MSIEHFLKNIYLNIRTFLAYGQLRPSRVRLVDCNRYVHIDPKDQCAWKKQVTDPIRGKYPHNIRFWREACARLKPDFGIDVGLNFGECTFSADYAEDTRIVGIEANQRLQPYLKKSLAEHPQRQQIDMVFALAGERASAGESFFVDKAWSGGSSAAGPIRGQADSDYEEVIVPMIRIDEHVHKLADSRVPVDSIVFKIDVEGYEPKVLDGMEQLIENATEMIGLIEFGEELLDAAGIGIEDFWNWLHERFEVFAFRRNGKLADARQWSLNDLRNNFGHRRLHTDLILLKPSSSDTARNLVTGWLGRTRPLEG